MFFNKYISRRKGKIMNKVSLVVLKHLVLFFNFAEFTRNANKIGKNDFIKILTYFADPSFHARRAEQSNIPPKDNLDWNSPVRTMELLVTHCGWLWNKKYFPHAKEPISNLYNEMKHSLKIDRHMFHGAGFSTNGSSLLYEIKKGKKVAKKINFANISHVKIFVDDAATYYRNIRVQINNTEFENSLK